MSGAGGLTEAPIEGRWQAIVVGAGVAGIVVARRLVDAGVRTLLVDAKQFPRDKVCGGCLSERCVAGLDRAGFSVELAACGGLPFDAIEIRAGGRALRVPTPPGVAIPRRLLDGALLEGAQKAGVVARLGLRARVEGPVEGPVSPGVRGVRLTDSLGVSTLVEASVVIAADGLGSPSTTRRTGFRAEVATRARIGVGAIVAAPDTTDYPAGSISMAIGRSGYVGVVRCAGGLLDVAAAFDPSAIASAVSLPELIDATLGAAGFASLPRDPDAEWRGVPRLSQSATNIASERVFLVGDAVGYVEPFTGEGMANAVESALALAPLAIEAARDYDESLARRWSRLASALRTRRRRDVGRLAWIARRPSVTRLVMGAAAIMPRAAEQVAQRIARSREGRLAF